MQISLGLPAPNEISSFPRLQKVQLGIHRSQETVQRTRLPITPHILGQLLEHWFQDSNSNEDTLMLWAAATLCYFGFFRSGEITVSSKTAFQSLQHLAWGDVAVDNHSAPQVINGHLKSEKPQQQQDMQTRSMLATVSRSGQQPQPPMPGWKTPPSHAGKMEQLSFPLLYPSTT